MGIADLLRSTAFRLAVVFAVVVTLSTAAVFAFVYWRVADADMMRAKISLADEVTKAAVEPTAQLQPELRRRLTRDLRQIEYVGLFDAAGDHVYGNVQEIPAIPLDGETHIIETTRPDGVGTESAFFAGRKRLDGSTLVLGRGLYEIRALQQSVLRALVIGIGPTILLALLAGIILSLRASRRLRDIHLAIDRVIQGNLHERLPANQIPDGIDEVVRSVNQMLDEITRLVNQLKQVGDNIAHDLRTPLTVAHIRLERALNEPEEELRETARQILGNLDRALTTVTALLRISELESGLRRSAFAPIDVAALCYDVYDFYEPIAEAKSIAMKLDLQNKVTFIGDGDLLREALTNLVDNAIKFTPQNGSVQISVQATAEGPCVRICDSGPGILPTDRDKIFKRFYRSAATDDVRGNGLGLSMAATIAELHGLTLRLDDSVSGACFEIGPTRQDGRAGKGGAAKP
ncbi:sensor histidine kinase [Methylovirgula ligni]|uniref:histidine kinase n=1 Tax=Methylovirgula ligni TaxID=569860 RepID=A0A3D9YVB2_9HYPH|nr:HAMP domain-containing sensor histidine kinase [Methylovirgula ligni]QAY95824.1 sensor histidine kinase [Methylovirgula ligni]REF86540.1 signal transduction histidine kinase [Methylovirgula ligni]